MIKRCMVLKKIDLFHFLHLPKTPLEADREDLLDREKLETALCLENILTACFKSLICLVHNRGARKEFLRLGHRSMIHQRELMRLLDDDPDSAERVELKCGQYLSNLDIGSMPLAAALNLTIGLSEHTMDIYKYLSRTAPCFGSMLDNLVQDNMQEIDLLRSELEYHQQKPSGV